jgi:hypothetical protein
MVDVPGYFFIVIEEIFVITEARLNYKNRL